MRDPGLAVPDAVGAFLVVAALILLAALVPRIGALIASIPPSIAQAMLAGVLLPLCLAPVTGIAASGTDVDPALLIPTFELTAPTFTPGSIIGIALPLFIVTMASQNVPGIAIMRSYGYTVPWRPAMLVTGIGSAISAALAAAPDAEPDPARRWVAGVSTEVSYIVLGAFSAVFAALVLLAPAAVIPAVAGLALLSAFGSSVQQAIADPGERMPAVVTFLVAASGVALFGISAAFWAVVAGLLVRALLHTGMR